MMKFLMFFLFLNFIFNKINKFILQLIYQNLIFLMFVMMLMNFPMNNLNYWMKLYYIIGCDFISLSLIMLTLWILSIMVLVSGYSLINLNYYLFINILNFMLMFLIMSFLSMNMMMFYMCFESSLIPVFMLIMGWGYQIDRIQAAYYMMIYTLVGSLPLLVLIINEYSLGKSLMLNILEFEMFSVMTYLMSIIAFLIKMPMYLVHLWLPKAHVEAPLVGSMILAGVMLKLGSYGLMRFMLMMMSMCLNFNKFMIILSLMGGLYSSLICLYQVDMKLLVAYSSVVHMSILMAGMFTLFHWGYIGSSIMMISHGLCSSGLFCLVNMNYERLNSRSLFINKGMINFFPSLSLMWFLLCSSNLSFPPSLNLFGEIMLFNSIILWNYKLIILLMILSFLSASYTLYLYSYSQHGYNNIFNFFKNIMISEFLVLLLHWIPLNLLFLMMFIFI